MTVTGTKAVLKKAHGKSQYYKVDAGCIKYVIKAYLTVDGQKKYIAKSKINHTVGPDHNLYSDARKITTKKSKYTLKAGKTAELDAKVRTYSGKSQVAHSKRIKYVSSDKSVAKVNRNGRIKAVGTGNCKIYVVSACGLTKIVKVNVK